MAPANKPAQGLDYVYGLIHIVYMRSKRKAEPKKTKPKKMWTCQQCGMRDVGTMELRKHVCSKADAEAYQKARRG